MFVTGDLDSRVKAIGGGDAPRRREAVSAN